MVKFANNFFLSCILFVYPTFVIQSQFNYDSKIDKNTFYKYSKSSKYNDLSKYLNKNVTPVLLGDATTEIKGYFEIDEKGNPWNYSVNVKKRSLLRNNLISILANSDIKQLVDLEIKPKARYSIGLVSKVEEKYIINASTNAIWDELPEIKDCQSLTRYSKINNCFLKSLKNHFLSSISQDLMKKQFLYGYFISNVSFTITKEGKIINLKCVAPTKEIEIEINKSINLFEEKIISPAKRNNEPIDINYKIDFEVSSINEETKREIIAKKNKKLTEHFQKYIKPKALKEINLKTPNDKVLIYFTFNNARKIENISTNLKDYDSHIKFIKAFKKIPIEAFKNLPQEKDIIFSFAVVRNIDKKSTIICDQAFSYFTASQFKKCDKCKNFLEIETFNNSEIKKYILNNFQLDKKIYRLKEYVPDSPKLISVSVDFQVDYNSEISFIKVRTKNKALKKEFTRILKLMPKFYKPATFNGTSIRNNIDSEDLHFLCKIKK